MLLVAGLEAGRAFARGRGLPSSEPIKAQDKRRAAAHATAVERLASDGQKAPACAFALLGVCQRTRGTPVLDDIHLEIPAEQVTAIVGPSGAGKTSLLRLLNRLDDPTGGEIRYRGWPLAEYPCATSGARLPLFFRRR